MTPTPFTSREHLTRRRLLGTALAAGVAAPLTVAGSAWAASGAAGAVGTPGAPSAAGASSASGAAQLTLPRPTGPHPVGVVPLHLVDPARPDPLAGPGHFRELMVSVWYPARDVAGYPRAPWLEAGVLQQLLASAGFPADAVAAPLTDGHQGAPVRRTGRRLPVVVYSHGAHSHRGDTTVVVQELASHGYVVVTVGHTYDTFVQFPDGRILAPVFDRRYPMGPAQCADDLRFVLDCVDQLAAGHNPDADHRALPTGLAGAVDPQRIGVFGWSKGGTAAALTTIEDPRVRAGLSFDGPMQPTITTDLDKPFMMMTAVFGRDADPDAAEFWTHLRGWRLNIQAAGAVHSSYGDDQVLVPQLAPVVGMTAQQLQDWIGTLDPARAVRIQQAYPLAFFDRQLRHRGGQLLDGPSRAFPEVAFLP
ncbi:alpha/beta hydrolase family protein [Kitasatospora sp. LaBMicrA B282]|uniref:alpha/beta hydrolase family protein n=1 Tax=Kitasatospora sp. LaBMicrA B282 TaxID=3420949 RepID=UPI003D0AC162